MFHFPLETGRRRGAVRRSLSRGWVGSPKTGRSRAVKFTHPLLERPETVREALRALRSVREAEATVAGRTLDPLRVHLAGRAALALDLRRLAPVLRLAGVRYRNPEQLRHTFASTLLSRGFPLLYVQEQGGWANATVLLKNYSRWIPREAPAQMQPSATPAQLGA